MKEAVIKAFSQLAELLDILERRARVRAEISGLLGKTVSIGTMSDKRASFTYTKVLGELPPEKRGLLELLNEYSYAPYAAGTRIKLSIGGSYVQIVEEGKEHVIKSGSTGVGDFRLSFLLKLALYFDEEDWEEMNRLARERLREEVEILEKLKTVAAAIELLLNK